MSGPGEIKDWLVLANTVIGFGAIFYAWLTRTGKEAVEKVGALDDRLTKAIKELNQKIDAVEDRIARVEGELKGVPDRESVHKMQIEMERMRGTIEVLNERLVPLAAISGRLQEFLLEQSKRP